MRHGVLPVPLSCGAGRIPRAPGLDAVGACGRYTVITWARWTHLNCQLVIVLALSIDGTVFVVCRSSTVFATHIPMVPRSSRASSAARGRDSRLDSTTKAAELLNSCYTQYHTRFAAFATTFRSCHSLIARHSRQHATIMPS
jgi:hypothetical protein